MLTQTHTAATGKAISRGVFKGVVPGFPGAASCSPSILPLARQVQGCENQVEKGVRLGEMPIYTRLLAEYICSCKTDIINLLSGARDLVFPTARTIVGAGFRHLRNTGNATSPQDKAIETAPSQIDHPADGSLAYTGANALNGNVMTQGSFERKHAKERVDKNPMAVIPATLYKWLVILSVLMSLFLFHAWGNAPAGTGQGQMEWVAPAAK